MHTAHLSLVLSLVSTLALAQSSGEATEAEPVPPVLATGHFGQDPDGCPPPDVRASAREVFDRRLEAFLAGDIQTLTCFYAPDATVILPGAVLRGRAQVMSGLLQFGSVFGGAMPRMTSVTADGHVVLATFTLTGPVVSIPDGADTFVIVGGRVVYQTVHATVLPTAVP